MQPCSREMQGIPPLASSSSGQIALAELQNGHQQQQIQGGGMQAHYDQSTAVAHDDFFDQMLSTLPSAWPDLGNPKSPWDLGNPNGSAADAEASGGQKLFSMALDGKAAEEQSEGLQYAPYDESSLLASRLRQHQISGGSSPGGKPMVLQLNQHHLAQQQQMLLPGMGRSPSAAGGGGESGLLPLPLSLGSGGLVDRSRDEGGEGLYNGFGGSLQCGAPRTASQQHFQHPQGASMPAQSYGGAPVAGAATTAGSAGGGAAPPRQRVRARRGQATDPHSIAERLRRERIAERMKALQELVPNANKTDKASMLDEIIDYVKFLQLQVKVLSMSRLGGAAAVAPLVADISSSEGGRGGGGSAAAGGDGLAVTEHQVAKLMEEDMGSAMQYLQGKGLCLMPISLASAISTATCHPRVSAGAGGLLANPTGPGGNNDGDGPSSPSMSVLTVQSAMANGGEADALRSAAKDATSVSKP